MKKECMMVPDMHASTLGTQTHRETSTGASGSIEISLMAAVHLAERHILHRRKF